MHRKTVNSQNIISMEKFLRDYLEIQNEKTIDFLTSLTHGELKEICEEMCKIKLHTLPFKTITKEEIQTGRILLVLDKSKNTAPYRNPRQVTFSEIIAEGKKNTNRKRFKSNISKSNRFNRKHNW